MLTSSGQADLVKKIANIPDPVAPAEPPAEPTTPDTTPTTTEPDVTPTTAEPDVAPASDKPAEPEISAALLDILDVSIDKWEQISAATKDTELKKAMDKVEQIALAESKLRKIILEEIKLVVKKSNKS